MMQKKMLGLLFGGALLASCNQAPLPEAALDQNQPQGNGSLQSDLAAFKQLQLEVSRGEQSNPVDSEGTPVDLPLLISQLEHDLAEPASAAAPEGLSALAIYAQRIYTDISADDNFTGNLAFNKRTFPRFVWTNDGCSVPGLPSRFKTMIVFHPACVQHDFGYRNVKAYPNLMNENHRDWVDAQFKRHMRTICSRRTLILRPGCYVDAEGFWGAVRNFGRDSFYH